MRKHATKEENHLWYDYLRTYPVRFNRQRIIGSYIADFYCARARLIVELDGSQHYSEHVNQHDFERTKYLNSLGLRVLRFDNQDVRLHFESVCAMIDEEVRLRLSGVDTTYDD